MKMIVAFALFLSSLTLCTSAQMIPADNEKVDNGVLTIQPINHATLVLTYNNKNIYIDPTGGAAAFTGLAAPDLSL